MVGQGISGNARKQPRPGPESGIATLLPAVQSVRDFLSESLKGYTWAGLLAGFTFWLPIVSMGSVTCHEYCECCHMMSSVPEMSPTS